MRKEWIKLDEATVKVIIDDISAWPIYQSENVGEYLLIDSR